MIRKIIRMISIFLVSLFAFYFTLYSFIDGKSNFSFDSAISDTDYAKGYSDIAFLSVKEGQSKEQVINKIGEGFECTNRDKRDESVFPSNYFHFCKYSKSDIHSYRSRIVVYDKDYKVIAKLTGVIPD